MLKNFHICPICKLPGFREQKLCRHCAIELRALQSPITRPNPDFNIRSLFAWDEKSPNAVKDIVYALKGVEDSQAWLELALWMIHRFSFKPQNTIFVPIPGLRPNHSHGMAAALSRATGKPSVDLLTYHKGKHQKRLGRDERNQVEFALRSDKICMEYRDVIIVDDVVTTGATARAAYEALLRPKNAEVWCLVDRRPCGP